jgi:hypothetical protein
MGFTARWRHESSSHRHLSLPDRSSIEETMKYASTCLALACCAFGAAAAEPPQCRQQTVEKTVMEMCLLPGGAFQHDLYTLKADKVLIFALVDDYAEKVELEHAVPEGPAIEFPLSRQGEKIVRIRGGCVPENKDGAEVARLCNFYWGKQQVVKDVRFEFQ